LPLLLWKRGSRFRPAELSPDHDKPSNPHQSHRKNRRQNRVEMEALTAVSIAALTVYECANHRQNDAHRRDQVLKKTGGTSGK